MKIYWAAKWRSENKLDGKQEHFIGTPTRLFRTRQKARDFIQEFFGYIKTRPDLQEEPHGWKMPIPVKVQVMTKEI